MVETEEPLELEMLRALPELYRKFHLAEMVHQGKLTLQEAVELYREAIGAPEP